VGHYAPLCQDFGGVFSSAIQPTELPCSAFRPPGAARWVVIGCLFLPPNRTHGSGTSAPKVPHLHSAARPVYWPFLNGAQWAGTRLLQEPWLMGKPHLLYIRTEERSRNKSQPARSRKKSKEVARSRKESQAAARSRKQPQAVASSHKQSQAAARSRKQSQEVASSRKQLLKKPWRRAGPLPGPLPEAPAE
jgi:hypothetical protein